MDIVEEDGIGLKNRYGEFLDRSADNAPDLRQSIMDETDHYYDPILENPENLRDRGKSYLDPTKGIGTGEGLLLDKLSGDRLTSNLGGNLHIKDIPKNLHEEVPTQILEQKAKELEEKVTAEEVNALLKAASEGEMKGILGYSDKPLVSIDYNGDSRSSIVDGLSTMVMDDTMLKVMAWYDNEWGYSCRVIDLAAYIGK